MKTTAPTVVLDTTLHDLYRADNESGHQPTLVCAPFHVYQRGPLTKFIYHAGLRPTQPAATNEAVVMLRLRATPQRHLFAAGRMPVVVLTSSGRESGTAHHVASVDAASIQRSTSLLPRDQRPNVTLWPRPEDVPLEPGSEIALSRPTDCLSHLPHLIDPEVHYEILSKRGLAQSGLPTPPSTVVDTLLRPGDGGDMRDPAKTTAEATRMLRAVDTYKLPFVVKLPQSAGKGTFVVTSDADRVRLTEMLRPQLQEMLEQVTEANHRLHPCSLVLQDYIAGKVVALSLFVTRKGRPIFVGCCKQKFNDDGRWAGGSISYSNQAELRQLYAESMGKAALFLHQKGYYGPAGIDILTNAAGEQYIIDLNVRITGTFILGLVTGHFTKRGLDRAMVEAAYFSCSRTAFEEAFARAIQDGRIIITAWTYDESVSLSFGVFIIGGSTAGEIKWQFMQVQNHAVLGLDTFVEC
ncbi:hypothetical protein C2857_000369 [Epichloe festucae Fl1]|uniref:ATP-grasp domain-containing protein n=1 Tax=Epichloe festucae (strain Fl1) TaxID=877507 RepID=A0A7S9PX38_EPIFF|nr:hypothetical protein C2857_000369 [Epichloe festucae Fl1]